LYIFQLAAMSFFIASVSLVWSDSAVAATDGGYRFRLSTRASSRVSG
jgi:hypothetical protein